MVDVDGDIDVRRSDLGRAEAALLSRLRHPYVLHFFGCCHHQNYLYIVTELCDLTLQELLRRRHPNRLPQESMLSLALQVAEGLQCRVAFQRYRGMGLRRWRLEVVCSDHP